MHDLLGKSAQPDAVIRQVSRIIVDNYGLHRALLCADVCREAFSTKQCIKSELLLVLQHIFATVAQHSSFRRSSETTQLKATMEYTW